MRSQVTTLARMDDSAPVGSAWELWRALNHMVPMPGTLLQTQPDGTIFFCHRPPNGVSARALYGRNVVELVPPHTRHIVRQYLAGLAPDEALRRRVILVELPTGARAWYLVTAAPIAVDGRLSAITIIARQVTGCATPHAAAQSALERVRRSAAPDDRAAQRLELVGIIASGLVHSFNNILGVIGCSSELLGAALPASHHLRGDIDNIRHAVRHGASVTRQLLQLAKPHVASRIRVDLNAVVATVADLARLLLGNTISLHVRLESSGAPAVVDSWEMEQALLNLVINARDALPNGGTITITTSRTIYTAETASSGCRLRGPVVRVCVADDGMGIDEWTRLQLFEPFFTTKHERGTGLGLATVRQIVTEAHGCVELTSRVGYGTVVELVLPDADRNARCAA